MSGGARKSRVIVWRDAIGDDEGLTSTQKLVALTLAGFMNRHGVARPGRATIARRSGLSVRVVSPALDVLEDRGYLFIDPPKVPIGPDGELRRPGGKQATNRYYAQLPVTANDARCSEWKSSGQTGNDVPSYENPKRESRALKRESRALNRERRSHESAESAESGATASPLAGYAAAQAWVKSLGWQWATLDDHAEEIANQFNDLTDEEVGRLAALAREIENATYVEARTNPQLRAAVGYADHEERNGS